MKCRCATMSLIFFSRDRPDRQIYHVILATRFASRPASQNLLVDLCFNRLTTNCKADIINDLDLLLPPVNAQYPMFFNGIGDISGFSQPQGFQTDTSRSIEQHTKQCTLPTVYRATSSIPSGMPIVLRAYLPVPMPPTRSSLSAWSHMRITGSAVAEHSAASFGVYVVVC